MTTRRRGRSDSMIKLIKERKESKLRYDEAVAHDKSGNYMKALESYNRVRKCTTFYPSLYIPSDSQAHTDMITAASKGSYFTCMY